MSAIRLPQPPDQPGKALINWVAELQVMQLAEERAPQGFSDIHTVISQQELETIAARYKQTAGFTLQQVNR